MCLSMLNDQDDAIGLFYDVCNNVFIDEDGFVVFGIFEFITPNDLYLFRQREKYMVVNHRSLSGVVCELYYPEEDVIYG